MSEEQSEMRIVDAKVVSVKTRTTLRLTEESLHALKLIKKATKLPMSTILEGIVLDHMDLHHKRYLNMIKKWKKIKELNQQIEEEIRND